MIPVGMVLMAGVLTLALGATEVPFGNGGEGGARRAVEATQEVAAAHAPGRDAETMAPIGGDTAAEAGAGDREARAEESATAAPLAPGYE